MNTRDIVRHLALNIGRTQADTRKLLTACLREMTQVLDEGRSFTIPALGTFRVVTREARLAYSPRHKEKRLFPPKRIISFRPAAALKRRINAEGGSREN